MRQLVIVEVNILDNLALIKCDQSWVDLYYTNPNDKYITNYWKGLPYNEKFPSWEYLLEGNIILTQQENINEIDNYVKANYSTLL